MKQIFKRYLISYFHSVSYFTASIPFGGSKAATGTGHRSNDIAS